MRRLVGRLPAAALGAVVGVVAVLSLHELATSPRAARRPRPVRPRPSVSPSPTPQERAVTRPRARLVLAWSPHGLPADAEPRLEGVPKVSEVTTVRAGLEWLERSLAPDGTVVDRPPRGFAIPFELAVVDPAEYARFVPPSDRAAILALADRGIVLSETSARLRGGGHDLTLDVGAARLTADGIVSDVAAAGYEGVVTSPPPGWNAPERFVLARVGRGGKRAVAREVRAMLGPGEVARVRAEGETPFLRYGDAVLPQANIKEAFGEFPARPEADGTLTIDPKWVRDNVERRSVPVLGDVVCHRALFPQLRGALAAARASGAAYTINPAQFGGCYGPRFISRDPTGRISHHAWGIAFDLNVAENPYGARPNLDPGLVNVIERWGFTWGGRWLIPDGMHFEWKRFP